MWHSTLRWPCLHCCPAEYSAGNAGAGLGLDRGLTSAASSWQRRRPAGSCVRWVQNPVFPELGSKLLAMSKGLDWFHGPLSRPPGRVHRVARLRGNDRACRAIVVERGAHVRTAGAAAACCAPAAAACCGPVVRQQLQRVVRLACPQRVRVRSHPVRRVAPVRCDPTHLAAWPRRSWLSGRARLSVALSGPAFPLRSPGPRRPVARAAPLCASRVGCLCGARSQARSGRSSAAAARWCPMLRVPAHCALRQRRPVPRAVPLCAVRAVAWPAPAASSRAARPPRPRGTTRAARTVPPALCVPWSGRGAMTVVRRMVALRSSPGPFPRTPIASCGAASGVCSRLFGSPELQKGEGLKKTPFRNMKHDTSPKEGKKTVST